MNFKFAPFLFCGLLPACPLWAAEAEPKSSDQTQHDISALAERNIIHGPEYWAAHAAKGEKCDGGKVATLLTHVAQVFKPVKTADEAIAVLVERGVIGTPGYWTKNAKEGATCDGGNVAAVLSRIAGRLPVEPPPSAKATPLEAIAPAQIKDHYDIIIAGAGMGGTGAAVQAARMGRSVLLLEETDWIGGQAMAAGVTSMDEGVTLVRERGLYRELCGLISANYQPLGIHPETAYGQHHMCVEPRVGRHLLQVLLGDARGKGVLDLALLSKVTKANKTGDTVTGVEIRSGSDKGEATHMVSCKVLVDATEWGDVIPLTGARYRVGNCLSDGVIDPTRHVQDNTWCAVIKQYPKGVPPELIVREAPPGYTDKVQAAFARSLMAGTGKQEAQSKPWNWETFIGYRGMPDSSREGDSPPITRTHMNYNNDFLSTVAELESPAKREATNRAMRLKTLHLLYYIHHTLGLTDWSVANDEGYDTPYNRGQIDAWLKDEPALAPYRPILIHFCVMPYTRESRRIVGLHTLTAHEIERNPGRPIQFPDSVALGDYPVDMHGSKVPQYLEMDLDHESDFSSKFGGKGVGPFAIPFRCFIPEKVDGFLPAEKNLSQSRMANGATRLQPHTLNMGQAVGAIAALAVEKGIQPRAVDPVEVQRVLLEAGDTLAIDPVRGVRWGTPEWRKKQFEMVHAAAGGS